MIITGKNLCLLIGVLLVGMRGWSKNYRYTLSPAKSNYIPVNFPSAYAFSLRRAGVGNGTQKKKVTNILQLVTGSQMSGK